MPKRDEHRRCKLRRELVHGLGGGDITGRHGELGLTDGDTEVGADASEPLDPVLELDDHVDVEPPRQLAELGVAQLGKVGGEANPRAQRRRGGSNLDFRKRVQTLSLEVSAEASKPSPQNLRWPSDDGLTRYTPGDSISCPSIRQRRR
jgi:hypothetical protein